MSVDPSTKEAAAIAVHVDAFGRLVLALPGAEPVAGVVPVRCFPFTSPTERVSLCDGLGREVHCIADLTALPADTREVIERELERREFIPVVRRIRDVSAGSEPTSWHVDTDRGERRFVLTSEDHVRRLPPSGVLITDGDGVRYRVLDDRLLDAHSRHLLKRYL